MLVNTQHGDTFTLSRISSWLREAGFESIQTVVSPLTRSPIIVATKTTQQEDTHHG